MRFGSARSATMSAVARCCESRQRIGQGGDDARAQDTFGGAAAAGALSQVTAQERKRQTRPASNSS